MRLPYTAPDRVGESAAQLEMGRVGLPDSQTAADSLASRSVQKAGSIRENSENAGVVIELVDIADLRQLASAKGVTSH